MSYQEINWQSINNEQIRKIIMHADMLLRDLYGVFKLPIDKQSGEGEGNFTILIVILCIIDGLAVYIYPTKIIKDQERRFKQLIRDKIYWGPSSKGWIDIGLAAKQLYLELRNPLVHELGADKITSARQTGHGDPVIGKWAKIPKEFHDIDRLDGLGIWNDDWPAMFVRTNKKGSSIKVCAAALYWSVKRMINELINDKNIMDEAIRYQNNQNHEHANSKCNLILQIRKIFNTK